MSELRQITNIKRKTNTGAFYRCTVY